MDICPDLKNCFMFKEDGEIVAQDEGTSEKVVEQFLESFNNIMNESEGIGGIEGITLEGGKGRLNISSMGDIYLLTVTPKKADINYINTVTRVLIPTMLKLLDKIDPASLKSKITKKKEPKQEELKEKIKEELKPKELEEPEPKELEEPEEKELGEISPEPTVNQLIVEELGGLLVPSDTVRIDNKILSQWEDFSVDGKEIEKVEIETFSGDSTECKVKPIKDSKYENKGVIRMPEKLQQYLAIKKGELVRVKPILD
jgi:hypothetical protein